MKKTCARSDLSTVLSKNFTLGEFLTTSYNRSQLVDEFNSLSDDVYFKCLDNIALCASVMQTIRDLIGVPVRITSGYRSPRVNKLVKGVSNSAHLIGRGVDFTFKNLNKFTAEFIVRYLYRSSLVSFAKYYPDKRYIHITIS